MTASKDTKLIAVAVAMGFGAVVFTLIDIFAPETGLIEMLAPAMFEAMESQIINIQKAGRKATLEASTVVLSGVNPTDGNFREDEPPPSPANTGSLAAADAV